MVFKELQDSTVSKTINHIDKITIFPERIGILQLFRFCWDTLITKKRLWSKSSYSEAILKHFRSIALKQKERTALMG